MKIQMHPFKMLNFNDGKRRDISLNVKCNSFVQIIIGRKSIWCQFLMCDAIEKVIFLNWKTTIFSIWFLKLVWHEKFNILYCIPTKITLYKINKILHRALRIDGYALYKSGSQLLIDLPWQHTKQKLRKTITKSNKFGTSIFHVQ